MTLTIWSNTLGAITAATLAIDPVRDGRIGACGYLTKNASGDQIRLGLRQVLADGAVIDPAVQRHLLDAIGAAPPPATASPSAGKKNGGLPDGLTPREAEVLTLIASGLAN
ncbi:MAG: hypothetical protein ACRDPY_05910 [Streptosporangiaceae bacterium]